MPAGLEVINDNGVLQVTEAYRNYLFDYKVTLTGQPNSSYPYFGYFYTVTTGLECMVAFQGVSGAFVGLYSTSVNSTSITHVFCTPYLGRSSEPQATFFVFSLRKEPPKVNFGLEVYDDQGRLAFSSNSLYMKPLRTWSGRDYTAGNVEMKMPNGEVFFGVNRVQSVSSKVAMTVASPSGGYNIGAFSNGDGYYYVDEDIWSCCIGVLNNNLISGDLIVGGRSWEQTGQPNPISYYYRHYYHMLIDVSDL